MTEHDTTTEPKPERGLDVAATSQRLRDYAEHYVQRDWVYTRTTNIRHVRLVGDFSGYDHPVNRMKRTLGQFVRRDNLSRMFGINPWRHPVVTLRVGLRTQKHLPDGELKHSGLIAHNEEMGEYVQMVQPSVGSKIADVLDAHPGLPAVQALAAEIDRVWNVYGESLAGQRDENDEIEAGEDQA